MPSLPNPALNYNPFSTLSAQISSLGGSNSLLNPAVGNVLNTQRDQSLKKPAEVSFKNLMAFQELQRAIEMEKIRYLCTLNALAYQARPLKDLTKPSTNIFPKSEFVEEKVLPTKIITLADNDLVTKPQEKSTATKSEHVEINMHHTSELMIKKDRQQNKAPKKISKYSKYRKVIKPKPVVDSPVSKVEFNFENNGELRRSSRKIIKEPVVSTDPVINTDEKVTMIQQYEVAIREIVGYDDLDNSKVKLMLVKNKWKLPAAILTVKKNKAFYTKYFIPKSSEEPVEAKAEATKAPVSEEQHLL